METAPPSADSWAAAKAALRAADPRMASLVDADPTLDPGTVLDGWPTALWDALVFNVVGQQLSVAATRAILARLRALHDGRLPTPAELLATDTEKLRGVGLSRAKTVYLRDLAERLADGRLDLERLRKLDDDAARAELMQVKGVGRFTADGVLMFALRRPDIWPAANLALYAARRWRRFGDEPLRRRHAGIHPDPAGPETVERLPARLAGIGRESHRVTGLLQGE